MGAAIGRILAVDSVDMGRLADTKLARELAARRAELQAKGLSGIRLDYAVAQAKTELAGPRWTDASLPERQRPQPLVYRAGARGTGHARARRALRDRQSD